MDIHATRELLQTKSIYEIPLRVTYYARVSSEKDEQLNSLGNQIDYYENLIKSNANWTFAPGYIDEGLSGISTKKRERFNQMISDAKAGKFDLVITKEISRFARNTLDSIQYTRELLSVGVGVFFQNDNINTLESDSELRLSIMSSIAQDELRKLSERVKFGHRQAIKSKVVLGNSRIFGYQKSDGKLVVDEEQAEMIRELFSLYSTDKYSMKQIENILWEKGYRNYSGNRIVHSTLSGIISNPKYKGYYVGNKVKVVDMFTKKQKFLPPEEWVIFKDETGEIVPPIVSEEIWDKANEILSRRSEDVKFRKGICNHANLLTGKMYCQSCGCAFYRRDSKDKRGNKNSKWVCSGKINNGANSCPSFPIYESEIKPLLFETLRDTNADATALAEEYERLFRSIQDDSKIQKKIEKLTASIEINIKKRSKLLEYNVTGKISDEAFLESSKQCDEEIQSARDSIKELEEQQNAQKEFRQRVEEIRKTLKCAQEDLANGVITKEFIDRYIDKILVETDGDTAKLTIKIFTGRTCEKYLDRLKGRTGHTMFIMAPIRNVIFSRINRNTLNHQITVKYSVRLAV